MYNTQRAESGKTIENNVCMHHNEVNSGQDIFRDYMQFRNIFEAISEGFVMLEVVRNESGKVTDSRILEVNPACERHTCIKREQVLGKSLLEMNLDCLKKIERVVKTGQPLEFEEYVSSIRKWFHANAYTTGPDKVSIIFSDITERKNMENALLESEEKYRTLFKAMGEAFVVHEIIFDDNGVPVDGVVLDVNPAYEKMTGLLKKEILGKRCSELFPLVDSAVKERYGKVVRSGKPIHFEHNSIYSDRCYDIYAYSLHKENQFALIFTDISERKHAEQVLHQSEERFQKVFHSSIALIAIIRMTDFRYVEVNQRFLDITGYQRDEVVGNTPQKLNLWAEDKQTIDFLKEELIDKGKFQNYEISLKTKAGEIVNTLNSTSLIDLHGELCGIIIGQDISKEKKMEVEMQRLDRLNIVGEMAASIGHEVRNPMTTVRGYLQLFQKQEELVKYRNQLNVMIEELDLANNIISEFLSLAKNKSIVLQQGNLNTIVNSLFPLIQADAFRMGHRAILETGDIQDNKFDPQEMRQLILNLTRNALEAMQYGGILTIKTYCRKNAIVLEVQDTGLGIPDHVLQQIGKPFVTTKENGTGLGLPICYRIAGRHNAKLQINSSPHGTSICVNFSM